MSPPDLAPSGWHPSDGSNPEGRYYDTGTTEYVDDSGAYRITMYQHADGGAGLRMQAEMDRTRAGVGRNPWLSSIGLPSQPDYYRNANTDQAEQLAKGLSTREPPSQPKSLYTNVDHPTMLRMVTEQVDPGGVGEAGSLWSETGNQLIDFQRVFAQAISKSKTDWSGAAGDRARKFTAKMANWVGEAGRGAALSGTQMATHAEALSTAKNSMPEPVTFDIDAANARLQNTSDPFQAMTQYTEDMRAYNRQREAQQQAARVMHTFDTTLGGAVTMPAFAEPPTFGGGADGSIRKPGDGSGDGGGTAIPPHGGAGIHGGTGANAAPSIPGRSSAVTRSGGAAGSSGAGGHGGGTDPGRLAKSAMPGAVAGTAPAAYNSANIAPGSGAPSVPGVGGSPTRGGSGGAYSGAGFGGVPLGGLLGGGIASGGTGGASGFGPRAPGAAVGGSPGRADAPGGRTGAGAPGAAAAEQAATRTTAAGGRGAGTMGGPMGGGRGGNGEDKEHTPASFLVEVDPDEIFGTDQKTAPPVIGG